MNEIERFKKGRMIPKGLGGFNTGTLNGRKVTYKGMGWIYDDTGERVSGRDFTSIHVTNKEDIRNNNMNLMGLIMQKAVSGSTPDYSWMANRPARLRTPEEEARLKDPKIQAYLQRQQKEARSAIANKPGTIIKGAGNKKKVDYAANFAGMNFTDDEKKYMLDAGFDPTNAKSVQEFILSKAAGANLGARKGAGIADGYWGDKSAAAFQALRNQGMFTPKVDAQEPIKPINETPIDAPDPFGYESKGNYSLDNAKTLKTDGIRDWTTMMNYIKGNQNSAFSQDMMHRFGSDLSKWNQKDVESAMGVSGHYGRNDRSRIQGFMAGNLANWNNQRQTAINDYAKKTFLKNQAGMNTLGDAGAGTMAQLDVNNMSERLKFAMGV